MRLAAVIFIIAVALFFDYTNGFHDAANSIATVVSTRVLSPRIAVVWAAVFNFVAFLIFGTHVANTVGKTVNPSAVSEAVVFAGLLGAIAWNLITWWLGLPTSSSHSLIGGFAGAGIARYLLITHIPHLLLKVRSRCASIPRSWMIRRCTGSSWARRRTTSSPW